MTIIKFNANVVKNGFLEKEIPGGNYYSIELSILLDGVKHYNHLVNIEHIAEFLNPEPKYREYSFWTCSCGVLGCLGLDEMNILKDNQNEIKAFFKNPNGKTQLIHIEKEQLKNALIALVEEIDSIKKNTIGTFIGIDLKDEETHFSLYDLKSLINSHIESYNNGKKSSLKI